MFPLQPSAFDSKPCHNCRRSRLKCDRSLPHCRKCLQKGRECLGYQRLLRWEQGLASRGKMVGKTFGQEAECLIACSSEERALKRRRLELAPSYDRKGSSREMSSPPGLEFLWDPVFQDLEGEGRRYLAYFADRVCRDLVLHDDAKGNQFRYLVPLTHQHQLLLQIIIATSALHLSNAQHTIRGPGSLTPCSDESTMSSISPPSSVSTICSSETYHDALIAKQRALNLLKTALTHIDSANVDVILATVLLFVQAELIDTGRDAWKPHITGARKIIEMIGVERLDMAGDISELRRCFVANCLIYDVMGTTLTTSNALQSDYGVNINVPGLLRDAEGNHCASFPVLLLQLLQAGTRIAQSLEKESRNSFDAGNQETALSVLIDTAQSFDPLEWASQIQIHSPANDLRQRMHIASAHRSAVCVYLTCLQLCIAPALKTSQDLGLLVSNIVNELSQICADDAMLPATAWPLFVAGAETNDPALQEWAKMRFMQIWEAQPWGLIKGAVEALERLWRKRSETLLEDGGMAAEVDRWNWIEEVKAIGIDWLIL